MGKGEREKEKRVGDREAVEGWGNGRGREMIGRRGMSRLWKGGGMEGGGR